MAKFTPQRTGDDKIDRIQDAISRSVASGALFVQVTELPKPNAAVSLKAIYVVVVNRQPTRFAVCCPNTRGEYEWVGLGQSS